MVDKTIALDRFDEVLDPEFQDEMRKRNVVYIPNRSFTSYCDIERIETDFRIPMFGSRNMSWDGGPHGGPGLLLVA